MSNFDAASRSKIESVQTASRLIQVVYSVYTQAKSAQEMLQRFQAGTDPAFNAAINSMLTTSEKTEINAMLTDLNTLCTTWEAQHAALIASG